MSRMTTLSRSSLSEEFDVYGYYLGPGYFLYVPGKALQDVGVSPLDTIRDGVEGELCDLRNPFEFVPDEDTKWVSPHDDNYDDDYGG